MHKILKEQQDAVQQSKTSVAHGVASFVFLFIYKFSVFLIIAATIINDL